MGRQGNAALRHEAAAEELGRHLERNAAAWFRGGGAARARRLRTQERRNATLFHFDVELAGSSHPVVVKVPRPERRERAGCRILPDALRLVPLPHPAQRDDLEHATLQRIQQNFAGRDPRFGAIRVLDYVPARQALVMEACPDPNLALLYARRIGPLRRFGAVSLGPAPRHAGAWLRVYHGLPAPPGCRERSPLRSDFLASIDRMLDSLLEGPADSAFLNRLRAACHSRAHAVLPERLPLVPVHGDFVPRNVLVGPGGRVTVLDSRAQWLAPAYEDIARFRVALAASDLQMAGPAWAFDRDGVERTGMDFLRGYFAEEEPPLEAIRLFECQRLLAIWAAAGFQSRTAAGAQRWVKAILWRLRSRYVRGELRSILAAESGC